MGWFRWGAAFGRETRVHDVGIQVYTGERGGGITLGKAPLSFDSGKRRPRLEG